MPTDQTADPNSKSAADNAYFLLISEAVARLIKSKFLGVPTAQDVIDVRAEYPKLSAVSGVRLEDAKKTIRQAITGGNLAVYARSRDKPGELSQIPAAAIKAIIPTRWGGLPDHLFRIGQAQHYLELAPFIGRELGVRSSDFAAWMKSEKSRLKWPSQKESRRRPPGRPRLDQWMDPVSSAVREANLPVITAAAIRRRLLTTHQAAPSEDTIARILDRLYRETGNKKFARPSRKTPSANQRKS